MIEGLKPYAEYKESGLPWLDTVPKHWNMVPNRALMQDQRQVVGAKASDYTLLSLTLRGIIARDMVNPKGKFPAQFNTYKVVKPDDFVFCLFDIDETPRGVGLSPLKGMITGAYDIFSPTPRINPRFLYHYYLFVDEGKLMKPLYTGLRKTIQRGVFASLKAPLPPPDEQAAIVRFLDHANRKIDGFIRAKRKLIGLLNEQKQAIIHRAVTRGLNPEAPLKSSGIPWLGDIPKHWEAPRIKTVLLERDARSHEGSEVLLSLTRNRGLIARSDMTDKIHSARTLVGYKLYSPGEIVMNRMQAWSGMFGTGPISGMVSPDYAVYKILGGNDSTFLLARLKASDLVSQFAIESKGIGTGFNRLYNDRLGAIPISLSPPDEQRVIAKWIEINTSKLSSAIARTEREIALMQEYRTRLTADIVTGKLDVREAAAKLPDLPTETTAEPLTDEAHDDTESEEIET